MTVESRAYPFPFDPSPRRRSSRRPGRNLPKGTIDMTGTNLDALFTSLTTSERHRIFQALATECERLEQVAADDVKDADALLERYAMAMNADDCCGVIRTTHAYCQ